MPGIFKPKYSKSEVYQRFNLKELLGYSPSEEQKELFYELVVNKIVQRTAQGKDINGSKFARYSEDYAKKKGVSRGAVDLILEGDMLASFEEAQGSQKNIVKIKMQEGKETLKSFNHCTGDTLPKRTFFGISESDAMGGIVRSVDRARSRDEADPGSTRTTMLDIRRAIESTISVGVDDGQD